MQAGEEPQEQAETHAEQDAGRQGKVKRGMLALVNNVSRQVAQAERELAAEVEESADERKDTCYNEQRPAEFSQWIHLCAISI